MSDADEDFAPPPTAPAETIRMGGIRLDKEALAAGIEKGNISITSHVGGAETIRLTDVCAHCSAVQQRTTPSQASRQAHAVQREVLEGVDLQRRMRQMVVPTNDAEVRKMLRSVGQPITLFGEREVRSIMCCSLACTLLLHAAYTSLRNRWSVASGCGG